MTTPAEDFLPVEVADQSVTALSFLIGTVAATPALLRARDRLGRLPVGVLMPAPG